MSSQSAQRRARPRPYALVLVSALSLVIGLPAGAADRDSVKFIHDRLTGVPPSEGFLSTHQASSNAREVARAAMQQPEFYNVTLKNFATPWTNEDQTVFAPLNDYTATVIAMIREDVDFREVLYGDLIGVGNPAAYSRSSNAHYEALENNGVDLSKSANLQLLQQSTVTGLPASATAGVMTTRAAGRAFFYAGTNRAMFRFTLMNHLCYDLEALKDIEAVPDRIRQDVSRSPGGDSRIFMNSCIGCHAGMDGMTGAFAHYEWVFSSDPDSGRLVYDETPPDQLFINPNYPDKRHKYLINENNFINGYFTTDDSWINYWRNGQNAWVGWDTQGLGLPASGSGAKSLGKELANTDAFATCQAKKVFKAVCLREPKESEGVQLRSMADGFKTNGYKMKGLFEDAVVWCLDNH